MLNILCGPALLNIGFSFVQIVIDLFKQQYNTAFFKFIFMIIITIILDILCQLGLTVISWLVVFLPFIFMTVITSIALYIFGMKDDIGQKIDNRHNDDLDRTHKDNWHGSYLDASGTCNGQPGVTWCESLNRCDYPDLCPDNLIDASGTCNGVPGFTWCESTDRCVLYKDCEDLTDISNN